MLIILIGVCGCGKTSVGQALAEQMNLSFRDADEFHSTANKEKMSKGIPLTDEDRIPWLLSIHQYMKEDCLSFGAVRPTRLDQEKKDGVITCSGLKRIYRQILLHGTTQETDSPSDECLNRKSVLFVLLHGKEETIRQRMKSRQDHFMPPSLLQSQLSTLEFPDDTEHFIKVDVENSVGEIVNDIIQYINGLNY